MARDSLLTSNERRGSIHKPPEVIDIEDTEDCDVKSSKEVYVYKARDQVVEIYLSNLDCLSPGKYLGDSVIKFFTAYLLSEVCDEKVSKTIHVFDTYFHKRLCETFNHRRDKDLEDEKQQKELRERMKQFPDISKWRQLNKWFGGVDIFEKDFLVFPICQEDHWFAVVVCYPGEVTDVDVVRPREASEETSRPMPIPGIIVLDSLTINGKQYRENTTREIRDFLDYEWRARLTTIKDFSFHSMSQYHPKLPQQSNAFDCGKFILGYLKAFAQDPIDFYKVVRKYTSPDGNERHELTEELLDRIDKSLFECDREELRGLIINKCIRADVMV